MVTATKSQILGRIQAVQTLAQDIMDEVAEFVYLEPEELTICSEQDAPQQPIAQMTGK